MLSFKIVPGLGTQHYGSGIQDQQFSFIFSDVDQVHDIMDDLAEQHEVANEISEAISAPVGFGQDYDEVGVDQIV